MARIALVIALALSLVLPGTAVASTKSDPCNTKGIHTQQYFC